VAENFTMVGWNASSTNTSALLRRDNTLLVTKVKHQQRRNQILSMNPEYDDLRTMAILRLD
ncbi:MAG TPA: hypothetical protein PK992_11750, partial [Planctomycetaceae bacterium]|nr:hypothetical protein [Planctomycetaceae bacterium]